MRDAIVIGGGVAGLVAARELLADGHRVTLLEASDHLGGAVRSESFGGVAIDVGAEAFAVTRPETYSLIEEMGLSSAVIEPRRADARLALPDGVFAMPHAMLGVPTDLSSPEVVAILGEAPAALARERDARPPHDIDAQATLGSLVRDRMGDAVVERILGPVVSGVHAADPDLVECESVVPGLLSALRDTGSLAAAATRLRAASGKPGSALAGLTGGMSSLVTAMERDLVARGALLHRSAPVVRISRDGRQWSVECAGGVRLESDDLVVAISAPEGAALLESEPGLQEALGALTTGDVTVVALVVDSADLDADPVGSGLLIAPGHRHVQAKALTHATAKWGWMREAYGPGHHLLRLSYGRNGKVSQTAETLVDTAKTDVATLLNLPTTQIREARATRWDRSLVLPLQGHRQRVAQVTAAARSAPGLAVVGAGMGGNGLAGTIAVARTVREQLQQ